MILNKDQEKALTFLSHWWKGNQSFAILEGKAGSGKTYLVKYFLNQINTETLLLAPTHQARKQLENSLGKDKKIYKHEFKTIDSALGIYPTTTKETIDFEHVKLPDVWNKYQLAIVDEASMIPDWKLQLLLDIGIKILFIGHKSQLPPINTNKKPDDLCISPVFELQIPTIGLHIPQRNIGKSWEFCNYLEEIIYLNVKDQSKLIPNDFDIGLSDLLKKLKSKEEFLEDRLKIVAWSNDCVDKFNIKVRKALFNTNEPFVQHDKLILIEPLTLINDLASYNSRELKKLLNLNNLIKLYSNSALDVINYKLTTVELEKDLHVEVFKIFVNSEAGQHYIYVLCYDSDYELINKYYDHKAWAIKDVNVRKKAYREKFFILSCFAKVKYFYAATAYRMQGSTIENVIVVEKDVAKNSCLAEQAKTRYVAASRHKTNLFIYRGIY